MNTKFLFFNEKKSTSSHPLWENIKSVIETDNPKSFYARISVSMFNYFYRWYISCVYISLKTGVHIDTQNLDNIINHFASLCACILQPDNIAITVTRILNAFRVSEQQDIKIIKSGKSIDTTTINLKIYEILTNDLSKTSIKVIDQNCVYFDAVGTVIWLWIHLTASGLIVNNISGTGYWEFFDYIKYILSCNICRQHYETRVYPLLGKIKSNSKDVLMASILVHALVNLNKYETRDDYDTIYQSYNEEYYREYVEYWK